MPFRHLFHQKCIAPSPPPPPSVSIFASKFHIFHLQAPCHSPLVSYFLNISLPLFRPTCRCPVHHRGALQSTVPASSATLPITAARMTTDANFTGDPSPLVSVLGLIKSPDLMIGSTEVPLFEEEDMCTPLNISCACHTDYSSYEGLER